MFQSELGESHGDVVVILYLDGLYAVKCHIRQHHQVLAHTVDAIHCFFVCVNE
jgi:hypothetical protein